MADEIRTDVDRARQHQAQQRQAAAEAAERDAVQRASAWHQTCLALDTTAAEIAELCRELDCRHDLRHRTRRAWVFDITPGLTVMILRNNTWKRLNTWRDDTTTPRTYRRHSIPTTATIHPLTPDDIRNSVKPQITARATGTPYHWRTWDPTR